MKNIKVWKDPYNNEIEISKKRKIDIEEGLTVLVGCNGAGKSTFINNIKEQLNSEGIKYLTYNNLIDGGPSGMRKTSNVRFISTSLTSSEGENILLYVSILSSKMGEYSRKNKEQNELWFLIDAIDSGFSIDNIIDLKKYLFDVIIKTEKAEGKAVYIIVSANSFEMCNGENCLDIYNGKYVKFKNYNQYRDFIINSRALKEARECNEEIMEE